MCTVLSSDECMPQRNPQQIRLFHVKAVPWRGPAARNHVFEFLAIDRSHDSGRSHDLAWTARHDLVCLRKMCASPVDNKVTGGREVRTGCDCGCVAGADIGKRQRLARQVYAPHSGILVYVTQDICQLERPTKMMREQFSVGVAHAENAHT